MEFYSKKAEQVIQFINQTNQSIFLTGKAGTGKTTLLKKIIQTTHKNTAVVAPTGIAALNAGGVTIHSMFQLPFGGFIPDKNSPSFFNSNTKFENPNTIGRGFRMSGVKKSVIQKLELLIIDEVSMLRADVLDAMDSMMRKVRKINEPFGRVQVLFIGDLLQLPPIVKNEEWDVLKNYYPGIFFFHAKVIQQKQPLYIELTHIYRQSDPAFIHVLNNLRNNQCTSEDLQIMGAFVKPDFDTKINPGYITLTTHNHKADAINEKELTDLNGKIYEYYPEIVDDFPEKIYPVDPVLKLKVGAQIMFLKNDPSPEKLFFNGKMGIVKSLAKESVAVHFVEENKTIEVEKYEWQNIQYKVDESTKEIKEEVLGTFVHYPIKLAWAITVHKSQGLTFDKAILDVSHVFAPGQAYVALSRLRSLDGLVLLNQIQLNGISNDQNVVAYANSKLPEDEIEKHLSLSTKAYLRDFLLESFNLDQINQAWRNHRFSYVENAEKSTKTPYVSFAKMQESNVSSCIEPAQKFKYQLDKILTAHEVDYAFLCHRLQAAKGYFIPILRKTHLELLVIIEHIKRQKRSKEFFSELTELDELMSQVMHRFFKSVVMVEVIREGATLQKENLNSKEFSQYLFGVRDEAQQIYKNKQNENLVSVENEKEALYEKLPKKKNTAKSKLTTYEETFILWKENQTINQIAETRKLTRSTILSHFAKLISQKLILVEEVITKDRILELEEVFRNKEDLLISEIKEMVGDTFDWGELRIYKAHLESTA
jgi:uncharacterized protein YpbB